MALTLSSKRYGDLELRRIAAQVDDAIKQVPDVSAVELTGGERREIRIKLDEGKLEAHQLAPVAVAHGRGCRHPPDGIRGRSDGTVHEAHTGGRYGCHGVLTDGCFRGYSLGGGADSEATFCRRRCSSRGLFTRLYRRVMGTILHQTPVQWGFLFSIVLLLLLSASLVYVGFVKVKMLPFDNKSEFQVIVDMPDGTTLEETERVTSELASAALNQPEVVDLQTYAGTASPYNFNGLVRHYYLRRGPNRADIQVNLLSKKDRDLQSHAIAKQVRQRLLPIAQKYGARIKVAEVPPGPPVLQTLVAEVYGPSNETRIALARQIRDLWHRTDGVVDVDWYVEDDQPKVRFLVDREKAALAGFRSKRLQGPCKQPLGDSRLGCCMSTQRRRISHSRCAWIARPALICSSFKR